MSSDSSDSSPPDHSFQYLPVSQHRQRLFSAVQCRTTSILCVLFPACVRETHSHLQNTILENRKTLETLKEESYANGTMKDGDDEAETFEGCLKR